MKGFEFSFQELMKFWQRRRKPVRLHPGQDQSGLSQTFVINVASGFQVTSRINITGDAGDVFSGPGPLILDVNGYFRLPAVGP